MEIPLTQGKTAIIDDADWPFVAGYSWYAVRKTTNGRTHWYAVGNRWDAEARQIRKVRMHRLLLGHRPGYEIDHRNGNSMDNRRSNLRHATPAQNQANSHGRGGSSRFKNVSWNARKRRWAVAFRANGRPVFVGYFRDEVEAARAADRAMAHHQGAFARLNFPEPTEGSWVSEFVSDFVSELCQRMALKPDHDALELRNGAGRPRGKKTGDREPGRRAVRLPFR